MSARYREIEVVGSPFEMGQQLGEAAREEVRGFADGALERVNKTVAISRLRRVLCTPHVRRTPRRCAELWRLL